MTNHINEDKMTPAQIAARFGCTEEQARKQFERTARQLQSMANQAKRTGRKVNHYTAEQLDERAAAFRVKAGI